MVVVRTGETVTTGSVASSICPFPMNIATLCVPAGPKKIKSPGSACAGRIFAAHLELLARGTRQLESDAGEGVLNQA